MMKQENANGAVTNLQQTDIQKQRPVAEVAEISSVGIKAIRKVEKADVYNMEVDDNHNFSIEGGLIVHNCMDATRYFVKTKHVIRKATRKDGAEDIDYLSGSVGSWFGRGAASRVYTQSNL